MADATTTADNGVNVQALLNAREALTDARARRAAIDDRSCAIEHSQHRVGNGISPGLLLARRAGVHRKGRLKHDGGVIDSPCLYLTGLPLLRRRKSNFIYGVEDDARDLHAHLCR